MRFCHHRTTRCPPDRSQQTVARGAMSRIDLHLHTTHSDGSLSPAEVLRLAHKAGVTALAITDHDIVSGIPEAIAGGAELGIEIISGVEISSRVGNSELH